ncbi:hypothetical protein [Streptomyces sp. NPDC021224]|uniref:hypothetical protein n=1 Tax=unclassified Streptomyces TaxID=2593676 RepID=UPI0037A5176C
MTTERQQAARLWFGPAGLLDGSVSWELRGTLAYIDVPAGDLARDHTSRFPWALVDAATPHLLTGDGSDEEGPAWSAGDAVFDGFSVTEPLASPLSQGGGPAVPLFLTLSGPGADGNRGAGGLRTFSRVEFSAADGLFLLTGEEDEPPGGGPAELAHAAEALRRHRALFLPLNNSVWAYEKHFPNTEIEYKLTMRPPVDIWRLSMGLHRLIHEGRFGRFRLEFGNGYEICEFRNHLYEVPGPPEERGYVSFLPIRGRTHLVRRKWFAQDALVRREEIFKDVDVPGSFEDYIADTFGVAAVPLPPFTRVRYDINIESMRTGHVYCVLFDRCEADGHPDGLLQQCEVEYLRTRSALGVDSSAVEAELRMLKEAVARFLAESGTDFEENHLSKLSWLRELTALAPR